ncbi:MAG: GGDEF domain-containing protein [Solirubrobacterales bacterium]
MTESRRDQGGAHSAPAPLPEFAREDLATFEREYTIGRFSQRDLMLDLGAILWFLNIIFALTAGQFVDRDTSTVQTFGRVAIALLSSLAAVLLLTFVRKLDDERTLQVIGAMAIATLFMDYWLGTFGPGALGAMYVTQMAVSFYVAQFFGSRMLLGTMLLITALAFIGVQQNYESVYTPHLLAQTVLLVTMYWTVAYSLYLFKLERTAALAEAERVAFSDPLTGLPNTRMLRRRAEVLLDQRNERLHGLIGLLLIDLDGFRAANMLGGHRDGDSLLRAVADSVRETAPAEAFVARTGSDEFALLVPGTSRGSLETLGERVRQEVLAAIDASNVKRVPVDASIGTAISGEDGGSIESLLRAADHALYLNKTAHERHGTRRPRTPDPEELAVPARAESTAHRPIPISRWAPFRWSRRPVSVRITSGYWMISAIIIVVSLSMPDSPSGITTEVWLIVIFAALMATVRYFLPAALKLWQSLVDVGIATVALTLIVDASGRSASPTTALALLVIVYIGWFMQLRWVIPTSIVFIAVVLIPVLLDPGSKFYIFDAVTLFGGAVIAVALLAMLYYNHYYLERAEVLTTQLAALDPRTGAYNRRAFEDRMQDELDVLSYGDRDALAVVMVDLGNFKSVSANYGRSVGDRLLTEVAEALASASREEDCVARLGGDEFAVVAPGVDAASARALAERLVDAVRDQLSESDLPSNDQIRPGAGFALYGMHGRTTDQLVTAADVALTAAKTAGRDPNRVSSFVVAL